VLPDITIFQKFADHPNAAWPTRVIFYPLGARAAFLLGKLGITANQISVIGLFIAIIPVMLVIFATHLLWLEALALFVGLQLAYILDCADGVLARATGKTSSFGAMLDKLCDGFQTLCIPLLLLHSEAMEDSSRWSMGDVTLLAASFAAASSLLTHSLWFNSIYQPKSPEGMASQGRPSLIHRVTTFLIDSPTLRLGICVSWAFGIFIPFLIGLTLFNFLVFAAYILKLQKQYSTTNH
jgi:phosphatidylglycerophosphate synthase